MDFKFDEYQLAAMIDILLNGTEAEGPHAFVLLVAPNLVDAAKEAEDSGRLMTSAYVLSNLDPDLAHRVLQQAAIHPPQMRNKKKDN